MINIDQYEKGYNDAMEKFYCGLEMRLNLEMDVLMESIDQLIDKIWDYKSNMVINDVSYICKSDIVDMINEHFGKET